MRIFEILTLVTLFWALIVRFWPVERRPSWVSYLPAAATLFILIHLIVEGYRWQMVPDYTLTIWLFVLSLPPLFGKKITSSIKNNLTKRAMIGKLLGLTIIMFAISMPALVPVFEVPIPTGKYAVGTTSYAFVDESRPEIFTPDPEDKRLVYVQVWYPAIPFENTTPVPLWIDADKIVPGVAKDFMLPEFFFDHLEFVESNSYLDAPLDAEQETAYPVLVFSHGYPPGFFAQNMIQMEELASHGYIVFSVGHTYESGIVFDAQGQANSASETQVKAFYDEGEETAEAYRNIFSVTGTEQIQTARVWMAASPVAQQSMQIWTEDAQFLLTQIERMNSGQVSSPFGGHLDTSRIGMFGQSFGGAMAFQVCAVDSRCKASINVDGTQWGNLLDTPLQTPFMMMSGEYTNGINDWALSNAVQSGYNIWVRGTEHVNFTDCSLVSPLFKLPGWGILGSINGQQMERIMNAYILAFFDQTLKSIPSPLLQGNSPDYPEVEFSIIDGASK